MEKEDELKYRYKYPHPAVTSDCVVFGFDGRQLNVLLIKRGLEPFKGLWALPGGFMQIDESSEAQPFNTDTTADGAAATDETEY